MRDRKYSFVALVLSLFIPGLGQIYNGQQTKGLVILGSCLGLGLLAYWLTGFNRLTALLAFVVLWMSAVVDAYKMAKSAGQPGDFYYRRPYVISMLLLVGPLALPLLWGSPHFSRTARWVWTIIVSAVVLLFVATPSLIKWTT